MNIFVLVKQVPDTETRIKVDGNQINETGIKWIVSPFDEHAIEEAIKLKEKTGGTVTTVSLGPDRVVEALRTSYALGSDRAVHIKDDNYNVLDTAWTANVLAAFLKKEEVDIVLCGNIAIDSQSSMIPSILSEMLGFTSINNAIEVSVEGDIIKCRREIEGGSATVESEKPVIISANKSLNNPRYPSLKGIMSSKKKTIESVNVDELGISGVEKIEIVGMEPPPARPAGKIIEGASPAEKARELVRLLKEEAKVL